MAPIERLSELIAKRYPSDYAFEAEFGLPQKKVNDWKRGKSKTYLKMLPELAQHFGVSSSYLLCETDDPNPQGLDIDTSDLSWAIYKDSRELSEADKQELLAIIQLKLERNKK